MFVTALYSFRLLFLTFHGPERFTVVPGADPHAHLPDGQLAHEPHEPPWVVTVPLVLLAIPSLLIGYFTIEPLLFGGWLNDAITVNPANDVVASSARISTARWPWPCTRADARRSG